MAKILPFKALRYSSALAGSLDKLVTQPYDKIGRELQADYYTRHPLNIIRVVKSDEANSDPETDYPIAAQTLSKWRNDGTLMEDATPSFYVYFQTFKMDGREVTRKGFVASVELLEDSVRAHEKTLAGPKADRLRLLRAIESNDELIFMLYSDPWHETVKILDDVAAQNTPLLEARDDFGEVHRVWPVTDEHMIEELKEMLTPCDLYIADGHHRFETAVNYKRECIANGWKCAGAHGFDHRMMALFPMEDPGLVIFPTHRLVKNAADFSGPKLVASLGEHFTVTPFSSAEALFAAMDSVPTDQAFGMRALDTHEPYYMLQFKGSTVMVRREDLAGLSESSRKLGVTILHTMILEELLGITPAMVEAETHVEYGRNREKALERVGKDGIQAVFLLNPTSVGDVRAVAAEGERMPQKSTDFYPKLLAGLLMMGLEIKKG